MLCTCQLNTNNNIRWDGTDGCTTNRFGQMDWAYRNISSWLKFLQRQPTQQVHIRSTKQPTEVYQLLQNRTSSRQNCRHSGRCHHKLMNVECSNESDYTGSRTERRILNTHTPIICQVSRSTWSQVATFFILRIPGRENRGGSGSGREKPVPRGLDSQKLKVH
jgi:hypothetical protein